MAFNDGFKFTTTYSDNLIDVFCYRARHPISHSHKPRLAKEARRSLLSERKDKIRVSHVCLHQEKKNVSRLMRAARGYCREREREQTAHLSTEAKRYQISDNSPYVFLLLGVSSKNTLQSGHDLLRDCKSIYDEYFSHCSCFELACIERSKV